MITWLEEVVFLLVSCPPDPLSFHTFCKHLQEPIEIANCCMPSSINQWKSAKSLPICPPQLRVGCLGGRPPLLLPWGRRKKWETICLLLHRCVTTKRKSCKKNMMFSLGIDLDSYRLMRNLWHRHASTKSNNLLASSDKDMHVPRATTYWPPPWRRSGSPFASPTPSAEQTWMKAA